jgi:dTDP-4-dehydrorhamnose reductase
MAKVCHSSRPIVISKVLVLEQVKTDWEKTEMPTIRRILLLGSAGYLGRALLAPLQHAGQVVPTHRTRPQFALSRRYDFWTDAIGALLEPQRITLVVMAASLAYPTTDAARDESAFAHQAEQFVRACQRCRVILLSSDGIFDGRTGHYTECDLPVPITPYGRNLLSLEQAVQTLCPDYCIVRPSYLYGYSLGQLDHRLSQARARLLAGEALQYFSNMIKSPMEVNQVAEAITMLACSAHVGIVHVAGPAMSVYDFYREGMHSLGISCERLSAVLMPPDLLQPRDTSLDTSLMQQLLSIEPLLMSTALRQG